MGPVFGRHVWCVIATYCLGAVIVVYFVSLLIPIPIRVTLQPFLWGPCRETHCATCCHLLTKWSQKVSPSPSVLDCYIRTSRQPFQLTSLLLLKGQKHYPECGKNSEQPMKTCFLWSPYIRCLLHLQKKDKSWIWAWSPRIFSLGTQQK